LLICFVDSGSQISVEKLEVDQRHLNPPTSFKGWFAAPLII
jgi:hypothetical protein